MRDAAAAVRGTGWKAYAIGFLNAAFPFVLIAWGEKYVDSGVAAIANATVPIFVVLLALRFNPSERVSGARLWGILVGLVGVGVLAGLHPEGGWWAVADARDRGRLVLYACESPRQHNYGRTAPW
jgi:drug/metabolite transporter (DMT)-like permease